MLECVYTKDKVKKAKSWKDGFLKITERLITLYDEEKKKIYSFAYKKLEQEMNTPGYIIYCEDIEKHQNKEENEMSIMDMEKEENNFEEGKALKTNTDLFNRENKNSNKKIVRKIDYGSKRDIDLNDKKTNNIFNLEKNEIHNQKKIEGRSNQEIFDLFKKN